MEQITPQDPETLSQGERFATQTNTSSLPMEPSKRRLPDLVTLTTPNSPLVEQYKTLFLATDRLCEPQRKRIIAVTSATAGEGKSTIAANLAVVAARNFGRRCLLIDTHFKNPSLAQVFQLGHGLGLIDVMMSRRSLKDVLVPSQVDRLTLLPMGHFLGKKAGVLNVDGLRDVFAKIRGEYYNMIWNEQEDDFARMEQYELELFDYIFVDAPVSSAPEMTMIADAADALIWVAQAHSVSKQEVKRAFTRLDANASKVIGSVLNRANPIEPAWAYW